MNAKLLVEPIQVFNRLHEKFGLTREQLVEVVYEGVHGRAECTPNHPASMAGTRCWGDSTRALRDLCLPLGWKADNTDNIPSVFHPKLKIKIAVTNATSGTGVEWGHPHPIREKGDGAQRAVFPNQGVLAPVLDDGLNDAPAGNGSFWYLCIYCGCGMVRAELLCPVLDQDGMFKDSGFEISVTRKQA